MVLLPRGSLGGLVHDRKQAPRFVARQRPARRDGHGVALARFALLIVRQELGRAPDVLAVLRMLDQALDLHRDRLLHLVADDATGEGARLLGGLCWCVAAHFFSPAVRACASRMIVFRRAMLRRTLVN